MAKYLGSPWGTVIGKLNGSVGFVWHGIQAVKKLLSPTQRGTLLNYQQMKEGIIAPELFSYPQFNLRRCALNPLQKLANDNLPNWIYPTFTAQCKEKQLKMMGPNLFIKRNLANFFASMDRTIEYDPITNAPDNTVLVMSDGPLEPTTAIKKAEYNAATGGLAIEWDTNTYKDGKPEDQAWIIVLSGPLFDSYGQYGNWQPAWSIIKIDTAQTRANGTGFSLEIGEGRDPDDLSVFVFFFNQLIYSISKSAAVTTPP